MADEATGGRVGRTPQLVPSARWVLFALLLVSAALTLWGLPELQRAVEAGRWPPAALAVPPALLTVFVFGYGAYRIALVRAGRYPAGKALVQVAVMFLVVAVVAGLALRPVEGPPAHRDLVPLARPLASTDPDVRALGAELARYRSREQARAVAARLVELLDDPSPEVRHQAHAALVALAGSDVGGEGPGAPARWRSWGRSQGLLR